MDLLIVCLIVFLSHIVEGITGFGCMILALPFVSSILGLQTAVPVLVLLSTVFDLILISKGTCCINWKESKKIILITLFFMPFGFFLCFRRFSYASIGNFHSPNCHRWTVS